MATEIVSESVSFSPFFYLVIFLVLICAGIVVLYAKKVIIISKQRSTNIWKVVLDSIKPNKKKAIIFIITVFICFLLWIEGCSNIRCKPCPPAGPCHCGCTPLSDGISGWLIIFLPGIVYYLIHSVLGLILSKKEY